MNNELLASLDDEGLNVEAEYLAKEMHRAGSYESIESDPIGILLLAEMNTRRERTRNLYSHVNPRHESALTAFIQLQAAEAETTEWLTRVTDSPKYMKELRARRSSLNKMVEVRKKEAAKASQFIPEASGKGTKTNDSRRDGNSDKG